MVEVESQHGDRDVLLRGYDGADNLVFKSFGLHENANLCTHSFRAPDIHFTPDAGCNGVDDGQTQTSTSLEGILLRERLENSVLKCKRPVRYGSTLSQNDSPEESLC